MTDLFFYSKSGFAPYGDGSGFRVTVTIEQTTEDAEPTIIFEDIWRLPVSDWIVAARKIERLLDLVTRQASSPSPLIPPHNSGERLPSSDAADGGGDPVSRHDGKGGAA